jgi:hypothetical protein
LINSETVILRTLFLSLATFSLNAQQARIQFEKLAPALIQQRLEMVPGTLAERRATIESLFREVGCDGEQLTNLKVPGSKEPDIICALPAADPNASTIVVGGHYDHIPIGRGAVDDWSGSSLLPSLYQSLKSSPRNHRYLFIAFSGEEKGLLGSKEFVHRLSKPDRAATSAMVNLECLGLAPPEVWASRADKVLLQAYLQVTRALGVQAAGMNVDNYGDDDAHSFRDAKIPVLTIHSLTPETIGILHTSRDQLEAIHPEDYYTAYNLAATYLAYLDSQLPAARD